MFEQSYEFTFEAAHDLGCNVDGDDHPYSRVHGHSFYCTVTLRADTLGPDGWIMDFASLRAACQKIHDRYDHRLLNTVQGLEEGPTMERLCLRIAELLKADLPSLAAVELARPSLNERVRYTLSG